MDARLSTMSELDDTLAALADATRRSIVGRLAKGSATVAELVPCFDLTRPTISSHLEVLERAGAGRARRRDLRTTS